MGRDEELAYAAKHKIPVKQTIDSPYSFDDNMWGVTGESGEIEDPALIPPLEKILQVCKTAETARNTPELVELDFVKGLPIALNGVEMKLSELIFELNKIGAEHGVGVIHHIEDRVVGLKVRGIYEAPAAEVIIQAHWNLEKYVCTRIENEFKTMIDEKFAYLCYGALWYEPLMEHLQAYIDSVNEKVTGKVKVKLFKGRAEVVAMETPQSLFDEKMATFMKSESFNQNASPGFIELWTLQMKMAKQANPQILLSIGSDKDKKSLLPLIKKLYEVNNIHFFATGGTHELLKENGISSQRVYKISEKNTPNIGDLLRQKRFDAIVNIPKGTKKETKTEGNMIRVAAVEANIPLVTQQDAVEVFLKKLITRRAR
jgi:argininosuccinate synthase